MSTATMMVIEPSPSVHAHDHLTEDKTHVVEVLSSVTSSSPSACTSPSVVTTTSIESSKPMKESSTCIATTSISDINTIAIEQGTKPLIDVAPYIVRPLEDDARALHLAQRRLEIQLAFVDRAHAKIMDESHPDFQQRLQSATIERDGLLQQANQQLTYWETCTSIIYAYECAEARREYDVNCEKLRQEMLEEIQLEMDNIYEQRQGTHTGHNRKTTRKTRSRRQKILSQENPSDEEGGSGMNGEMETKESRKKRVGNVFPLLEKRLAHSEVEQDVRELTGTIESMKKKRRVLQEHVPYVTKYYRSTLFYQDVLFREGDLIFIQSNTTTSTTMNNTTTLSHEYIAIIISITSTELFVLSEIGTYHRLVFMDLRQGRIRISALTPEQTAALNERELSG